MVGEEWWAGYQPKEGSLGLMGEMEPLPSVCSQDD